jgi:hypothetical protein
MFMFCSRSQGGAETGFKKGRPRRPADSPSA